MSIRFLGKEEMIFNYIGEIDDYIVAETENMFSGIQNSDNKRLVKYKRLAVGISGTVAVAFVIIKLRKRLPLINKSLPNIKYFITQIFSISKLIKAR